MTDRFISEWTREISQPFSSTGSGGNKLRLYCTFKSDFSVETYVERPTPRSHRRALAHFRCGVAPIRIETGRYDGTILSERVCSYCKDEIEDECHVLLKCPLYENERSVLLSKCHVECDNFTHFNDAQKLAYILSSPNICFIAAKTCHFILSKRKSTVHNS